MKRTVGIISLIGIGVFFALWMLLIFTGAAFSSQGFSILVPIIFFGFLLCIIMTVICLIGDVIKFIGRKFSEGYTEHTKTITKRDQQAIRYCIHCGNPVNETDSFCPQCGKKVSQENLSLKSKENS